MSSNKNVVLLVGGVGGAKLAYGLAQVLPPENLTVIVNTGDDFRHYGLHISPDVDTIIYTLSGRVDKANGWGVAEDTTTTLEALAALGEPPWFRLGDLDLATHMLRTQMTAEGHTLTHITQTLAKAYGVACNVLPMADEPIATMVNTVEHGELGFQVYFVKHRWQPVLQSIRLAGIEQATLSTAVQTAITQADALIIGPSNPWLSINPILSVPGMRGLIASRDIPRIAVTPLIAGKAVKGPTAKLMAEMRLTISIETVMEYYGAVINGFVYDERDTALQREGVRVKALDTLMTSDEKRISLAQQILEWL